MLWTAQVQGSLSEDYCTKCIASNMASLQRRLWSIRRDRTLARYILEVKATGRKLGSGAYGLVEEVRVRVPLVSLARPSHSAVFSSERTKRCRV